MRLRFEPCLNRVGQTLVVSLHWGENQYLVLHTAVFIPWKLIVIPKSHNGLGLINQFILPMAEKFFQNIWARIWYLSYFSPFAMVSGPTFCQLYLGLVPNLVHYAKNLMSAKSLLIPNLVHYLSKNFNQQTKSLNFCLNLWDIQVVDTWSQQNTIICRNPQMTNPRLDRARNSLDSGWVSSHCSTGQVKPYC